MATKKNKPSARIPADLTSREAVERFREATVEFTRKATRSRESAMQVLVEAGIYTKSGKLAENYRS